ncbi:MAG TPA: diphosphomevalonate decarboxylase [Thermoprotei archaeon]|nr:diphosphomevalonate decarboxylase [Thermoprotei archaeon]
MTKYKASAFGHPIQGLIKYHGKIDEVLRLPSHNSISVNLSRFYTYTTVEISNTLDNNTMEIDDKPASRDAMERALRVFNAFRKLTNLPEDYKIKIISKNNFMSGIGLGSSSSGFAALTMAISSALKVDVDLTTLSKIARLGSGSASRSIVGGFSEWVVATTHEHSYSYRLAGDEVPLKMIVVEIPKLKDLPSTLAQIETEKSIFYKVRLGYIPTMLRKMRNAILSHDVEKIGELAEIDTLNLHAVIMTGPNRLILWRPQTVEVIRKVWKLRKRGVPAYFSIDTGATVYINTHEKFAEEILDEFNGIEGINTYISDVGLEAKPSSNHLF